jgi:hypothetical protein
MPISWAQSWDFPILGDLNDRFIMPQIVGQLIPG